jgi:WD40 repeat protein
MNVKSMAIDPEQQFILSGSSEGNAKLWDLPTVAQKECWEDIHMKHTFVRKPGVFAAPVSTFGVMQVLADKDYFYSCGSDGVLKRIQYTRNL